MFGCKFMLQGQQHNNTVMLVEFVDALITVTVSFSPLAQVASFDRAC